MIYMAPDKGNELIRWVGSKFSVGCFITYEQVCPSISLSSYLLSTSASSTPFSLTEYTYSNLIYSTRFFQTIHLGQ